MKIDISIIIPVLNEQAVINQAIDALYHLDFSGTIEVIVADGERRGNTIACIRNQKVIKVTSPPGRGGQMNQGAQKASGDILLFLHCDTMLPEAALRRIHNIMQDQSVKAGAFDLCINKKGAGYRMIEKTASVRSRLTRIPYGDQAIFIRRQYFFKIGQYRNIPIMEDVDLMKRIKKDKGVIKFLDIKTQTSSRRWEKEGMIYCTLRNWTILSLFFLGATPEKLAGFYKNKSSR